MQHARHRVIALVAIAGILVVAGTAWAVANAQARDARLSVDDAYFVERGRDGHNVTVEAVLYMSNRGERTADNIRVTVYIVPTRTGLATQAVSANVASIGEERTGEVHLSFQVARTNQTHPEGYQVTFLIFEDELLTLKGSGHIGYGACCFYGGGYAPGSNEAMAADGAALKASSPSFGRVG